MKTKVFKLTDELFNTYQAIANVDIKGHVYVHYINAFDSNVSGDDIPRESLNALCEKVCKWSEKQGYTMWSY